MPEKILIQHQTVYSYSRPVILYTHIIRLKPPAHCGIFIEEYSLRISPANHIIHWLQDPFGNFAARADFQGTVGQLVISVDIKAQMQPVNPFDFFVEPYAQTIPFEYTPKLKRELFLYIETPYDPAINRWLQKISRAPMEKIAYLAMLTRTVHQDVGYYVRMQPGVQTPRQTLHFACGSCRDSAWLMVNILRTLNLAARFVSGYIVQPVNNANLAEGYATGLHAWAQVFLPGAGWIGLDPSNGLFAAEGYIPLACTPHFDDAAAVTGTSEVCDTVLTYSNNATRIFY